MIYENEIHPPQVPRYHVTPEGAEIDIARASFPQPFHIGLKYASPARGHWTIAHSPMLIPECHEVYVCCACCLHGVVLSADEVPDGAARFSTVTLTNENLIKGNLEEMMIDGITHIIEDMPQKPKCVEGFTSCMQHFLHIDLRVVYDTLRKRFPDIDFIDGYMTPTLQRRFTPDILGRRQLMRAVRKQPRQKAVNYVVNYYPVDPENELTKMLQQAGYAIHDFADCKTYEEYKAMGESEANIYFLENAAPAAKDMEKRLDQKPLYLPYAYDYDKLRQNLQTAADVLGLSLPDTAPWEEEIEAKTKALLENVGSTHIAIDYTATPRPLGLAKFLLTHGFNVYAVYLDEISPEEKDSFTFLQQHYPTLSLRAVSHFKRRLLPRDDSKKYGKVLAIGQMAAYFADTKYFVNLIENSGLYGYVGLSKLIDWIGRANAAENPKMRAIIQVKAWGCHG
ncbi:nitrogenase component 1 [uncultured Megasphaera sp.]|uniref:nitrogenase component 1 n=1 Tax=uncultured Megasphaera sp. TaxID=165188 RepID=UPI0025D65EF0|nr:nitrogenase component 1 [uncultured Megasphaera sp.]